MLLSERRSYYPEIIWDEAQSDKPPPSEYDIGIEVAPYKIGRKEATVFFMNGKSCTSPCCIPSNTNWGANSSGYSVYAEDLYEYAQEAFCMSDDDHKRFLSIAHDEKPPILVLNVTVVEAQGLEAKDPNAACPSLHAGHPACQHAGASRSSDEEPLGTGSFKGSPRRQGGLKKLGASLSSEDRIRGNSISDTLPAKFIPPPSSPDTQPKWNEQFRLQATLLIDSSLVQMNDWANCTKLK
ncbi:protein unc-13-like protein D [Caerostris extrusa]|uniref:Protein unc-13-like protein D n=1 Tax=Caerostris extrusa TaxID=172846 RepID=A0AAV4M7D4_CAEEX|nr:protein unc-13-like protein D [Caerostris extrusa]